MDIRVRSQCPGSFPFCPVSTACNRSDQSESIKSRDTEGAFFLVPLQIDLLASDTQASVSNLKYLTSKLNYWNCKNWSKYWLKHQYIRHKHCIDHLWKSSFASIASIPAGDQTSDRRPQLKQQRLHTTISCRLSCMKACKTSLAWCDSCRCQQQWALTAIQSASWCHYTLLDAFVSSVLDLCCIHDDTRASLRGSSNRVLILSLVVWPSSLESEDMLDECLLLERFERLLGETEDLVDGDRNLWSTSF